MAEHLISKQVSTTTFLLQHKSVQIKICTLEILPCVTKWWKYLASQNKDKLRSIRLWQNYYRIPSFGDLKQYTNFNVIC